MISYLCSQEYFVVTRSYPMHHTPELKVCHCFISISVVISEDLNRDKDTVFLLKIGTDWPDLCIFRLFCPDKAIC